MTTRLRSVAILGAAGASLVCISTLVTLRLTTANHLESRAPSAPAARAPHDSPSPSATPGEGTVPVATCPASGKQVRDAGQLTLALASATPGDVIVLAPGMYKGHFVATKSGTAGSPIVLCGPHDAILDGGAVKSGYALYLNGASWWHVSGFTVQDAQKGIVADHATHDRLAGLYVDNVGDEAVHLRSFSSDNIVEGLVIRDTGKVKTKFGEGIYVGSAHKNWCTYSQCAPDASDRNVIRGNDVAQTTAENIDIKEGTTGGVIADNKLSGVGMDPSAATAWVNVTGNDWTITGNIGDSSPKDGFQVHEVASGWGLRSVFRSNHATVNGPGYGFYVQSGSLAAVVACDNVATAAAAGAFNLGCG